MDCIKFFHYEKKSYQIDQDLFEQKTGKKYPFYRMMKPGEISQFAVCPECNNPVQIIGLYKHLQHTENPFAKHCGQPVPDVGIYSKVNYTYCPYRARREQYTKDSRKNVLDDMAVEIVRRMVLYFDKIIHLLQSKVGFVISLNLAEQMLNDFFSSKAYLYHGATLRNMPLILAYFSLNKSIFGRKVFSQELIDAIGKISNLYIDEKRQVRTNQYLNVGFYFLKHRTHLDEHHLCESIVLTIAYNDNTTHPIYEKKIIFDNNHVENLLNYTPNNLTLYQQERNATLLDMAKKVALQFKFRIE